MVWESIFYSQLVDRIIVMLIVSLCITFVLWNVGGHAGEETLKYIQAFRKSPRFSFTLPLNQQRENSCLPDFTDNFFFLHFAHKWTEREFMSPWLYRYFFFFTLPIHCKWTERIHVSLTLLIIFIFFIFPISELRENSCLPDFTDNFFFLHFAHKWTEREFMSPWLYWCFFFFSSLCP